MSSMIIFKFIFNTSDQLPNETINDYICRLRELAKSCKSVNMIDYMERDRLLLGVKNKAARGSMLREADWTLDKAITMCITSKRTSLQLQKLQKDTSYATNSKHAVVKYVKTQVTRTLISYRLWTLHLKSSDSYTSIKVSVETVQKCLSTGYLQRNKLKAVRTKHANRLPRTETYQEDINTIRGNLKLELKTHSSLRPWNARWSSLEKQNILKLM